MSGGGQHPGDGAGRQMVVAFLLLDRPEFSFQQLASKLQDREILGMRARDLEWTSESCQLALDDAYVCLQLVPVPAPGVEEAAETTILWPVDLDREIVKEHRAHIIAACSGKSEDPIGVRLVLTKVLGLAARQPGVVAVMWGDSSLILYPPAFCNVADVADNTQRPPIMLWVDFAVFRNDDGSIGAFTVGLAPLGIMEIEVPRSEMGPWELCDFVMSLAQYMLEEGTMEHGDTIELVNGDTCRVLHAPSLVERDATVLRIEID